MNKKQVGVWALFDFANSVYPAVITTTVFSIYYVGTVVGNEGTGEGTWWWNLAVAVSALIVAVTSPLLGAVADRGGARKKFMFVYTAICLIGVLSMTTLGPGMVIAGFVIFVVANVGFESAMVFYNAYLPDIAPPEKRGWVSGLGFGVGYLGSAIGLIIVSFFAAERIGLVWPFVAGFFLIFSIPTFLYLPRDQARGMTVPQAALWGVSNFRQILREVWQVKDLRNFLIAFFFYIDGVLTIIVNAGNVATETFDFTPTQALYLFLVVQFAALAGAFALAKPTDTLGPKKVLNGVLLLWIFASVSAFFIQNQILFWAMAVVVGLGLGAVQSASRAFMSSLIPEGKEAEMFGFYALCGKSSSVIGPLLFGGATFLFQGNQRPSFLVIALLFIIGMVLLQRVNDPRAAVA
jgi:UMF1 family MFS transporter